MASISSVAASYLVTLMIGSLPPPSPEAITALIVAVTALVSALTALIKALQHDPAVKRNTAAIASLEQAVTNGNGHPTPLKPESGGQAS